MDKDRTTKKVFVCQPIGTRSQPIGRPNFRWIDGLEKELLVLRTKNWRTPAGKWLDWNRLLVKVKAHSGLSSD
ncbi:uncharacterized protein TNCV_4248951 [Trichonephila clavipes]|nr:uncharacterized protein TNCV_4248951 [Trichonephila clavipes]